jgi:hypothetical protein
MPIWLILIFRCVYKVVLSRVLVRVFSSLPPWPRSSFYTTKGYHNGQLEYYFLPNTGHVPEEQNDGWTPNGHRPLLSERYAVLLPPFWLGSSTDSLPPSRGSILSPREDPLPQPVALSFPKWPRHSLLQSGSDGALYMNRVPAGIGTDIPMWQRLDARQHLSILHRWHIPPEYSASVDVFTPAARGRSWAHEAMLPRFGIPQFSRTRHIWSYS